MRNKEKIRKLLNGLETIEDKTIVSVKAFEEEVSNLTKKVKKEVTLKTLESVNDELTRFRRQLDLTPILSSFQLVKGDFNSTYQQLSDEFMSVYSQMIGKIDSVLFQLQKFESKTNSLEKEIKTIDRECKDQINNQVSQLSTLVKNQQNVKENIDSSVRPLVEDVGNKLIKTKNTISNEVEKLKKEIEDVRRDVVTKFSASIGSRGGSMPLQVSAGGTVANTTYAEINFIGATASTNNTTKKTDITTSGGLSLLTATGTVNGSNTSFTFASEPSIIIVDNVPRQKTSSDGTTNWTGTTSVTLSIAPNFDIFGM